MSPRVELARPGSAARRLQDTALALLMGPRHAGANPPMIPTSIRYLLYELRHLPEGHALLPPKPRGATGRTPQQDLSDAVLVLRRANLIPWNWIKDETRRLTTWSYADDVYAYIDDALDNFDLNVWGDEYPPLILSEARTMGVLRPTAAEYLCPIAATGGQTAGFLHTDIIPLLEDKPSRVIYIGDHDKAGHEIEANTRKEIEEDLGYELEWERLALTQDQVVEYDIPPNAKVDGRDDIERNCYEVEALGQMELVGMLRDRLDALRAGAGLPSLDDIHDQRDADRDRVRDYLAERKAEDERKVAAMRGELTDEDHE